MKMVRSSLRLDRYSAAERILVSSRLMLIMIRQRPFRLALAFVDEIAIAAAKENQGRRRTGVRRIANNPHYEDDVVAAIVIRIRLALEMSESAGDQGCLGM